MTTIEQLSTEYLIKVTQREMIFMEGTGQLTKEECNQGSIYWLMLDELEKRTK